MTRKIFAMLVVGLFVGAFTGIALAEGPGYSGDKVSFAGERSMELQASDWTAADPVETGAVPFKSPGDKISPDSTHYNPFYPERRTIDMGGGGE
ncbi:MAG: hypothetical protein AB1346_13785 [Thermodesulfobacteriota bacterium]